MNRITRVFFVTAFTTMSAAAQQETNPPPAESQSLQLQIADQPDEDRIQFLFDVSSAYLREGDPASAITAYERILEMDPMNKMARFMITTAYITTKQYAKAEQMLTSMIEEFPEDVEIRNNLAWLYATAEDPAFRRGQRAIELAQEAMVLAPNSHHVWSTLAEAYYSTGQYENAYRAITHMASLTQAYGINLSKEIAESYTEQLKKCKRSLDTEKAFQGSEVEPAEAPLSVDEDAQ